MKRRGYIIHDTAQMADVQRFMRGKPYSATNPSDGGRVPRRASVKPSRNLEAVSQLNAQELHDLGVNDADGDQEKREYRTLQKCQREDTVRFCILNHKD
jgi:hypothetical protein